MTDGFEWKYLKGCEYGVASGYDNEVEDCGEPSYAVVWWKDDKSDAMRLCRHHFDEVRKTE